MLNMVIEWSTWLSKGRSVSHYCDVMDIGDPETRNPSVQEFTFRVLVFGVSGLTGLRAYIGFGVQVPGYRLCFRHMCWGRCLKPEGRVTANVQS